MKPANKIVDKLLEAEELDWTPDPGDPDDETPGQFIKRHPDIDPRLPTREEVSFELESQPEDYDYRDRADEDVEWIDNQLARGNTWAWCCVKVSAFWLPHAGETYEGRDYLGGCSYLSRRDFMRPGGYYDDMKDQAFRDLIKNICRAKGIIPPP